MAALGSAKCPADVSMMSARGRPNADVIRAFNDVSIDLVNVDEINGKTGSTSRWGPHVSGTESLTSGSHVSGLFKGKGKRKRRKGVARLKERNGPARKPTRLGLV